MTLFENNYSSLYYFWLYCESYNSVKRVCHILICCFLILFFYSLLWDTFHFSEIKFYIYFKNFHFILHFLVHKLTQPPLSFCISQCLSSGSKVKSTHHILFWTKATVESWNKHSCISNPRVNFDRKCNNLPLHWSII